MRMLFIHPNDHSGGAAIVGNWPPAWVACLSGALQAQGDDDIRFIDAMTNHLSDDQLRETNAAEQPDLVGVTAITPAIHRADRILQIAKVLHPDTVTVPGGIHGTFMYRQVLAAAPRIDTVVRGEGEDLINGRSRDRAWPR